jgi:hypothetical protein
MSYAVPIAPNLYSWTQYMPVSHPPETTLVWQPFMRGVMGLNALTAQGCAGWSYDLCRFIGPADYGKWAAVVPPYQMGEMFSYCCPLTGTAPSPQIVLDYDFLKVVCGIDSGQPPNPGPGPLSVKDISGAWVVGGGDKAGFLCKIEQSNGQLTFIDEVGRQSAGGFVDANTVEATGWNRLRGRISADGARIDWSNGSWWVRPGQAPRPQPRTQPQDCESCAKEKCPICNNAHIISLMCQADWGFGDGEACDKCLQANCKGL